MVFAMHPPFHEVPTNVGSAGCRQFSCRQGLSTPSSLVRADYLQRRRHLSPPVVKRAFSAGNQANNSNHDQLHDINICLKLCDHINSGSLPTLAFHLHGWLVDLFRALSFKLPLSMYVMSALGRLKLRS